MIFIIYLYQNISIRQQNDRFVCIRDDLRHLFCSDKEIIIPRAKVPKTCLKITNNDILFGGVPPPIPHIGVRYPLPRFFYFLFFLFQLLPLLPQHPQFTHLFAFSWRFSYQTITYSSDRVRRDYGSFYGIMATICK